VLAGRQAPSLAVVRGKDQSRGIISSADECPPRPPQPFARSI
jgi:hypothetical protein